MLAIFPVLLYVNMKTYEKDICNRRDAHGASTAASLTTKLETSFLSNEPLKTTAGLG